MGDLLFPSAKGQGRQDLETKRRKKRSQDGHNGRYLSRMDQRYGEISDSGGQARKGGGDEEDCFNEKGL
jgi:hypothetical protein